MAYEFYVTVEGSKQGRFKGESDRQAHADKVPGLSFHYSVASPRDAASGMATGRRTHQPVSFVKEWGAATPQFQQAMITNELFKSVLFEFLKVNDNGEEYVFHTIKLGTALISEIQQYIDPAGSPGSAGGLSGDTGPLEKISFNFQRIEITNIDGQTTAVDELRAQREAPDPG